MSAGRRDAGQTPIGHQMERTSQEILDAGMAVRREVLGDAHVDRAEAKKDETTEDFQNLISRYAWGTVWTRPGLDRRMSSVPAANVAFTLAQEVFAQVDEDLAAGRPL